MHSHRQAQRRGVARKRAATVREHPGSLHVFQRTLPHGRGSYSSLTRVEHLVRLGVFRPRLIQPCRICTQARDIDDECVMSRRTMTFGQWRAELGQADPLADAPRLLGWSDMQVREAVLAGKLRVSTFHASDGRIFKWVRRTDLIELKQSGAPKPVLTLEGMKAAFQQMVSS